MDTHGGGAVVSFCVKMIKVSVAEGRLDSAVDAPRLCEAVKSLMNRRLPELSFVPPPPPPPPVKINSYRSTPWS